MAEPVFTFRKCLRSDITSVITFCNANGFTARNEEDWIGGGIEAALAFDGDMLIGAFPFFKRQVLINSGTVVTCGYFTAVAIHEDYRSAGLGSKLLATLYSSFEIDGMFVNSSEDDRAYRWYSRNGYDPLSNITVYKTDSSILGSIPGSCFVREITDSQLAGNVCVNLKQVFDGFVEGYGGFEDRDLQFWNQKLQFHYYRSFNRYFLITDRENDFKAYAIAAISSYPSRPVSVDIMEMALSPDGSVMDMIKAVAQFAAANKITPVRIPLEESSSIHSFLLANGFAEDWSFCMLYHPLHCLPDQFKPYKYFHFDYA